MKVCGSQEICPFKSRITTGGCIAADVCPGYSEPWHWSTTAKKAIEEAEKQNWLYVDGNKDGGKE